MRKIEDNGLLIAVIVNVKDFPNGMRFWGSEDTPLQFGSCVYTKGTILKPHVHKERDRIKKHKTQEFLYVIRGAIKTLFFNNDREYLCSEVLREGDCVLLYDGGHGFKVLKEGTTFIEVKNGPYVSVEADKEKFDDVRVS